MAKVLGLVIFLCALLWHSLASAAAYRVEQVGGGSLVRLDGEIQDGDLGNLRHLFVSAQKASRPVHTVILSSPGGQVHEALLIGRFLREQKVATRVDSECASACVYAFLGGVIREVGPHGRFGVHMHSGQESDEYIALLRGILLKREYDLDTRIRYIVMLNESASARISGQLAAYTISMGVSVRLLDPAFKTLHFKIHWLSDKELSDFNVVNAR